MHLHTKNLTFISSLLDLIFFIFKFLNKSNYKNIDEYLSTSWYRFRVIIFNFDRI